MSIIAGYTFVDADIVTAEKLTSLIEDATISEDGSIVESNIQNLTVTNTNISSISIANLHNDVKDKIWPIGKVEITLSSTNPGTRIGYGTWVQIGQGRMLKGASAGNAGISAGSASHNHTNAVAYTDYTTLTAAQSGLPAHSHPDACLQPAPDPPPASPDWIGVYFCSGNRDSFGFTKTLTASGTINARDGHRHAIGSIVSTATASFPRSLCLYFWKRTA
jgi:hypothetical protein